MQVLPAQVAPKDDVRPPQSVTIPALIGQRYADAAQRLQGIAKVERRQRASSRPFDIVIDQSPGASVVPWPATVVLTVSDGSLVVVPPLQKQSLAFAMEQLKRQGLSWSVVEQDSRAPVGTVIRQAPEPGREVPRGTSVGLTVAKRPSPSSSAASPPLTGPMSTMTNPPVAIPRVYVRDYVGAAAPVAASELSSAGLKPQVQSRPSVRPRGEVFDQKPRNVEAPRGTVVDLLASDGSLVVMPSLRGQRIDGARTLLNRLELRPTFEEQPASAPPGTVIDQGIAADTVVRRGSTVRVVVAAVPPAPIVVRDYVGWSANEARADLQRQKLQAATQVRASSEPRERVVDQMPRNVEVKAGATVTLVVSDGTLVRVPRVTRLPLARAEQALQESDLTVQRQRRESDAPAGTVLQQDPAPDTEVPRGSAVRVFVAAASPMPPTSLAPPAPSIPPAKPPLPSALPPPAPAPEPPLANRTRARTAADAGTGRHDSVTGAIHGTSAGTCRHRAVARSAGRAAAGFAAVPDSAGGDPTDPERGHLTVVVCGRGHFRLRRQEAGSCVVGSGHRKCAKQPAANRASLPNGAGRRSRRDSVRMKAPDCTSTSSCQGRMPPGGQSHRSRWRNAMNDTGLTLSQLLAVEKGALQTALDRYVEENDAHASLPGTVLGFVAEEAAAAVDKVLDRDVFELVFKAWAAVRELHEYADPSKHPPGERAVVRWGKCSLQAPQNVDIKLGAAGVRLPVLRLTIDLAAEFDSLALTIQGGAIRKITPGAARASVGLKYLKTTLIKPRKTPELTFEHGVEFAAGLPIE